MKVMQVKAQKKEGQAAGFRTIRRGRLSSSAAFNPIALLSRSTDRGYPQAKLKVGSPGDIYEQQADRISEQVMNMPEPVAQRQPMEEEEPIQARLLLQRQTEEDEEPVQAKTLIQRQAEEEEEPVQAKALVQRQVEEEEEPVQEKPLLQSQSEEEEETAQAKGDGVAAPSVSPPVESGINSLRGGGQPLPESTRAFFEPRFRTDFRGVRVHTDARAAESAHTIAARAYTGGQDITFGPGQYAPHTNAGLKLLAHELTHVVQQSNNSLLHTIQCLWYEEPPQVVIERQRLAMERLRRLERAIVQQARQQNVPVNILRGIIHYETLDRGLFESLGETYKIGRRDWSVSLGPGDITVRRVADLLYPRRNWEQRPLTTQEFIQIVNQLYRPEDHARILAQSMREYFVTFGRIPGKTVEDRWRFAIASHKWGERWVGNAQVQARDEGRNLNSWSDVSHYVADDVVEFVNNVMAYTSTRLSINPYL